MSAEEQEIPQLLSQFEDDEVVGCKIDVRGVGGGLQDSLNVSPVELRRRQRVRIILDCYVDEVDFPPERGKSADPSHVVRRHVLRLYGENAAMIVDGKLDEIIVRYFEDTRERIRLATTGQPRMEGMIDAPAELEGQPASIIEMPAQARQAAGE